MAWIAPAPTTTTGISSSSSMPHLILHFDINETILVGDEAGGDSQQDCFNKMLAKSAFVRISMPETTAAADKDEMDPNSTHDTNLVLPTHWWTGRPLDAPNEQPQEQLPPPLYTDWEWPNGCCPYYRTVYKKRSKTFVQHHGSIYRSVYHQLQAAFPKREDNDDDSIIVAHILPAFFHTLRHLPEDGCTSTTIVLRTFGSDLIDIATAVSKFAQGKHPDYSDFQNQALVVSDDALVQGRWAVAPEQDSTTTNTSSKTSRNIRNDAGYAEPPDFVYQLWNQNNQLVASGDAQVLQFLHSHTICGIQDDYEHWRKHHQEPWAGKPVWIPSDPNYHHIVFDDNM